jgi:hypothetical protein
LPCAPLVVVLLAFFAGSSGAGVANYTGTLYLSGPAASVAGSYQLMTTAPPATPVPAPVASVSGAGTVPAATYQYVYVVSSGSSRSASAASNQLAVPANSSVSVANVPVGSLVFRQKVMAGLPVSPYVLVSPGGGTTATPFVDDGSNMSSGGFPQADARVQTAASCATAGACGYVEFTPGFSYAASTAWGSPAALGTVPASPSIPSTCKGWLVDGAGTGSVSFAAGNWQFQVRVKTNAGASGTAYLTVGLWKVDDAGAPVSGGTLIDPTQATSDGSQNLISAGMTQTITYTTPSNVPAFTLSSSEHLCVQFWRHQTAASGGAALARTLSLLGFDPANAITLHPAPNGFATATLTSPADAAHTQTIPALGATYADAEGDAGTITIQLCADSGCGSVLQSSGAIAATSGSTQTWTPTGPLADNTYWWSAQAKDGPGLATSWTATRSFVVDTQAPATSITSNPPALSNASAGGFSFAAGEAVTGYQCKVDAGAFAGCASPYNYSGLADGAHTFQVKATADLAGNAGSPASYSWTIDTAAPNTSLTSTPASLSTSSSPSFSLSATEPGSSFECNLDGGGFSACSTSPSYSAVADGPHTFQARAIDQAGNVDPTPVSYSWTIDATPPDTSIGPSQPAALTIATGATFDFSSTEPGSTFACSRDGAPFTSCTSPKTYSGLADGSHTFQVRATDAAGNTDGSPASYTWVIDTTPPDTTIGPTVPPASSPSTNATFDLGSTEPGSTYQCRLDGGAYGSCASPVSYSGLANGTHTFYAKAVDSAGNIDGSAASYSWDVDTVFPATPAASSPADALLTNAVPALAAIFSDATPGDSGTVDFRICSTSAPAATACAPMVSSVTSGSVTNGGTASVTPAPLPDGTYHWQVRAQDLAGNQSGWSATRSFRIDSSAPTVPALVSPEDGAWLRQADLQAVFSKPAFAGTGTIEFRVCSDGACLGTVSGGTSPTLINGSTASWSLPDRLSDGLYWWQARAHDGAGNTSAWSAARTFHVDKTPPPTPKNFSGTVADDGLTLRWDPPADDSLANFYVYVNGVSTVSLGVTTYEYKVGSFDAGDPREFAVVAVDHAGNQSPMSKTLVGVPNVVGLTLGEAENAAKARGLVVRRDAAVQQSGSGVITSQNPAAGSVAEKGTAVKVVLETASAPAALTMSASPSRLICGAGSVVRLQLRLSESATVRARLLSGRRTVQSTRLGRLKAGTSRVQVKLQRRLARGNYKLALDAAAGARTASTSVVVKMGSRRACSVH